MLFPIVWEAIRQLGAKVICVVADGASANRKFFRMHGQKNLFYKTHNLFACPSENRSLFFISDPPHLIKTTLNCWSHSGDGGTRWILVRMCLVINDWEVYRMEASEGSLSETAVYGRRNFTGPQAQDGAQ